MKNTRSESNLTADTFLNDLQTLVRDAEKLFKQPNGEAQQAEEDPSLRERFEAAQDHFNELYAGAKSRLVSSGKVADKAIRENPYQSVAIAVGVGLLVGAIIGRRGR